MKFCKKNLSGKLYIPASKSHLHRILFSALLTKNITKITVNKIDLESEDILSTMQILIDLNCSIKYYDGQLIINSKNVVYKGTIINCNESATTLRIAIPILLYLFENIKITGTKKLLSRPLGFYYDLFNNFNIDIKTSDGILFIKGDIKPVFKEDIFIEECPSSQFISGLMFILPLVNDKCKIKFTKKMESVMYLEITRDILQFFSLNYEFKYVDEELNMIAFKNRNNNTVQYSANDIPYVEVDYSSLAFWLVAIEFGAKISFENKIYKSNKKIVHPDQYMIEIIEKKLKKIDLKNSPDLLPILLVLSCFEGQIIEIINFERNRLKESNRVEGMIEQLNKIGANIIIDEKKIIVNPIKYFNTGKIDSLNDHRIAMSFAIASLKLKDNDILDIINFDAINKSYPSFKTDYEMLSN